MVDSTLGFFLHREDAMPEPDLFSFDTLSPASHHSAVECYPLLAGRNALEALGEIDEDWEPFAHR